MSRFAAAVASLQLSHCTVYEDDLLNRPANSTASAAVPNAAASAVAPVIDAPSELATAPDASIPNIAAQACVQTNTGDYCNSLPPLIAAPVIDGVAECGLLLNPVWPLGWNGPPPVSSKIAYYAAAWSEQGLYVYVEVHGAPVLPHPPDAPLYCGDAVEIFVDSDAVSADDAGTYDAAGTMQFIVAAPTSERPEIEAGRFIQGVPSGPWISQGLATRVLPDGYAVEAWIGAADIALWSWMLQARLGFSLAIDVSAAEPAPVRCGTQVGQFFLRFEPSNLPCGGEPWCDARAFCRPVLAR